MASTGSIGPSADRSSAGRLVWRILNVALPVAAGLVTLIAIGIVVTLFWVLSTVDAPKSAAAPHAPRTGAAAEAAPRAAAPRVEPPSQQAPAAQEAAPAQAAQPQAARPQAAQPQAARPQAPQPRAAAAPPAAAPPRSSEYTGANSDAAKNRAIGEGLAHLGDNPELQRRLQETH